jgi:hypothetical protein
MQTTVPGAEVAPLELLVADAQRQFDVGGKVQHLSFWAFKVMCRTKLPHHQGAPLFPPVRRADAPRNFLDSGLGYVDYCSYHRFSDFEWLVEQLADEFPGIILPPIPDKESGGTTDKFSDFVSGGSPRETAKSNAMVQTRIRRFNMFFDALCKMPVVHESPSLKAFVAMEEPEWLAHKEEVRQAKEGKGFASVKKSLFKTFSKMTEKKIIVFDTSTVIGTIQQQQLQLGEHIQKCYRRIYDVQCFAYQSDKPLNDTASLLSKNAAKSLTYPLVFPGHFVAEKEHMSGTVKFVDDELNYAFVDWGDGKGLARTPLTALQYPESGICDPALMCVSELTTQIESFFAYISHRAETRDLEALLDKLWFWRAYTDSVHASVERMAAIEQENHTVGQQKPSDAMARTVNEERCAALGRKFTAATSAFAQCYAYSFRPMQRRGLFDVNLLVGKVCFNLLCDDDWPMRVKRADAVLKLEFDMPDEVTAIMEGLVNAPAPFADASPAKPSNIVREDGSVSPLPMHHDPLSGPRSPEVKPAGKGWGAIDAFGGDVPPADHDDANVPPPVA